MKEMQNCKTNKKFDHVSIYIRSQISSIQKTVVTTYVIFFLCCTLYNHFYLFVFKKYTTIFFNHSTSASCAWKSNRPSKPDDLFFGQPTKFGLSEKHKIWKNLPHGFDKSADLLNKRQNHEEDFFKLCVLLRKCKL